MQFNTLTMENEYISKGVGINGEKKKKRLKFETYEKINNGVKVI